MHNTINGEKLCKNCGQRLKVKGLIYRDIVPIVIVKTTGHVKGTVVLSTETYEELLTIIKDNTVLSTLISKGKVTV